MENKKTQHIRTIILMALILFGLVFFVNIATKDSSDNSTETATKKNDFSDDYDDSYDYDDESYHVSSPSNTYSESSSSISSSDSQSSSSEKPIVSAEYSAALTKVKSYSDIMHMSKAGIYDQLTSDAGEQFPADAAQYAVDNLKADYNKNALKKQKATKKL